MSNDKLPPIRDVFTLEQRELLWQCFDHMEGIVAPLLTKFKTVKGWRKDKWCLAQVNHYEKLRAAYSYAKSRLFHNTKPLQNTGVNLDSRFISSLIPWSDTSYSDPSS